MPNKYHGNITRKSIWDNGIARAPIEKMKSVTMPVFSGAKVVGAQVSPVKKMVPRPIAKVTVSTKAGNYPVYPAQSSSAASFRKAFSAARKAKLEEFSWRGRKYTTKMK